VKIIESRLSELKRKAHNIHVYYSPVNTGNISENINHIVRTATGKYVYTVAGDDLLLPGFVEETIYRGIMFSAFRKYSILAGVVISAVSFGLMHLNFNQMPYAIYLGLIFAFMVEATGSITSTMVMHMIFNAFNTAYLYILPALYGKLKELGATQTDMSIEELVNKTPEPSEIFALLKGLFPLAVIGVVLVILIIAKIAEINGRSFSRESICGVNESAKGQKPVGIFIILGWIVCLIMSVVNLLFS
jgi:hypothetical protein